jgi:hypothetical protein
VSVWCTSPGDQQLFNPRTPALLPLPEGGVCGQGLKLLVVGNIPAGGSALPELAVKAGLVDEALHVTVGLEEEVVRRWSVVNGTSVGLQGEAGDGTTVDVEEPFVITYYLLSII